LRIGALHPLQSNFNSLARIFQSHSDNQSDNQAEHRSNFASVISPRSDVVAVMPAISSLHQPLPLVRFRSCAVTADRRRSTQTRRHAISARQL